MSLPSWAPGFEHVADYITSRTVDAQTPGSDRPSGTFSQWTYPTDMQVSRLIEAACGWVISVTGPVVPIIEDTARSVAAMRAAAMVEMSYPLRNDEITEVAQALFAQASAGRDELVSANRDGGGAVVSGATPPRGCFPPAPSYLLDGPGWGFPR